MKPLATLDACALVAVREQYPTSLDASTAEVECVEAANELAAVHVAAEEGVRRVLLSNEALVVVLLGVGHVGTCLDDMEGQA